MESGLAVESAAQNQGEHLSKKAGNFREFDSCQGNVGELIRS